MRWFYNKNQCVSKSNFDQVRRSVAPAYFDRNERNQAVQAYLRSYGIDVAHHDVEILNDREIVTSYYWNEYLKMHEESKSLLQSKKQTAYLNGLEAFSYLTYFIPGLGFLPIYIGHLINNCRSFWNNASIERSSSDRYFQEWWFKPKHLLLNFGSTIAMLFNPIAVCVGLGLTAFNAISNIHDKFSMFLALKHHQPDPNDEMACLIYDMNLSYAKSELAITVRNETVNMMIKQKLSTKSAENLCGDTASYRKNLHE